MTLRQLSENMRERFIKIGLVLASAAFSLLALEAAVRLLGLDTVTYHSIGSFCRYDETLGWRHV